jgi:hypothetical protein
VVRNGIDIDYVIIQVEFFWVVTLYSAGEDHAASIFRMKMETVVSCHNTTRPHNPENLDLNLHHRQNFKPCMML